MGDVKFHRRSIAEAQKLRTIQKTKGKQNLRRVQNMNIAIKGNQETFIFVKVFQEISSLFQTLLNYENDHKILMVLQNPLRIVKSVFSYYFPFWPWVKWV